MKYLLNILVVSFLKLSFFFGHENGPFENLSDRTRKILHFSNNFFFPPPLSQRTHSFVFPFSILNSGVAREVVSGSLNPPSPLDISRKFKKYNLF